MSAHSYPGRQVGHCTCGTWDHLHEPSCGRDVDDSEQPPAAVELLSTPTTRDDLVVLTAWMAGPGDFGPADIAEAVARPWKWEAELVEAREWAWLREHTERKTA